MKIQNTINQLDFKLQEIDYKEQKEEITGFQALIMRDDLTRVPSEYGQGDGDEDDQRQFEQDIQASYQMDLEDQEREREYYDEFNDITYTND